MSSIDCPTCGHLLIPALSSGLNHQCPPKWLCWDAEDGDPDDPRAQYASRAEYAAEEFAKYLYHHRGGETTRIKIAVRAADSSEVQTFYADAEIAIEWNIRKARI